jgi:esterase/lipase superfamily enzyme
MTPRRRDAPHQRVLRRHATLAAIALLAGLCGACSADALRGGITGSIDSSSIALDPTFTAFTTRNAVDGARARPWFGTERARRPTVARVRLSSPYESGAFSLAAVGLGDWGIASVEILKDGLQWSAEGGSRDVLVYVHGFNQTFEQAALDAARLSDGIKFRGETMLFSWPSKAAVLDYIYDRESAMWSRDAFDNMLKELITYPAVRTIHVVAHSMGTMLSVEALRQLYSRLGEPAAFKIGAVVLAAPDIDIDVFSSSVKRIGPLARKITVLTSSNDRALGILAKFAGGVSRVGAADKERLEALGLHVIDASRYGGSGINHDLFLSNDHVRQLVRKAIDEAGTPVAASASDSGLLPRSP